MATGFNQGQRASLTDLPAWLAPVLIALVCAVMTILARDLNYVFAWLAAFAGLLVLFVLAGMSVTRRGLGLLIDDRNVMSLARLQMAAWTILILSAYFAAVWIRLLAGTENALAVQIDSDLWWLMGISTTSLVGSPLILSNKKEKPANAGQVDQAKVALEKQNDDPSKVTNQGQLYANRDIEDARFSDMITGEDLANAAHLDLARMQMLYFTVVTLLAYAASLYAYFNAGTPKGVGGVLPALDKSMIALLGISHAGYLTSKAIPREAATSPSSSTASASGPADASREQAVDSCGVSVISPTKDEDLPAAKGGVA